MWKAKHINSKTIRFNFHVTTYTTVTNYKENKLHRDQFTYYWIYIKISSILDYIVKYIFQTFNNEKWFLL